jgi:aminoglycoside 2'-N-acetyltransferase I
MALQIISSEQLDSTVTAAIREMLDEAFGGSFTDDDWQHALGGLHVMWSDGDQVVAHASVVARVVTIGERTFHAGYVEAVGVAVSRQRCGFGTAVMGPIDDAIAEHFELGVLSTERVEFYQRLGWRVWGGPSFVRAAGGVRWTPEEDGGIMVLGADRHHLPELAAIGCDDRPGDAW